MSKIFLSFLVFVTLYTPIYNFFSWEKKFLSILLVPLAFQCILYVFWFKKNKTLDQKKSTNLSDEESIILASATLFLIFCITALDYILPYCLQQEHFIDNYTIILVGLFSLFIWFLLFEASLQEKLLHIPSKTSICWGKIMPVTFFSLIFGYNYLIKNSKILFVTVVFSVFIIECTLVLLYRYFKYKHSIENYIM